MAYGIFCQILSLWIRLEKKRWFTGSLNTHSHALVGLYRVNDATSDQARELLKEKLEEINHL